MKQAQHGPWPNLQVAAGLQEPLLQGPRQLPQPRPLLDAQAQPHRVRPIVEVAGRAAALARNCHAAVSSCRQQLTAQPQVLGGLFQPRDGAGCEKMPMPLRSGPGGTIAPYMHTLRVRRSARGMQAFPCERHAA